MPPHPTRAHSMTALRPRRPGAGAQESPRRVSCRCRLARHGALLAAPVRSMRSAGIALTARRATAVRQDNPPGRGRSRANMPSGPGTAPFLKMVGAGMRPEQSAKRPPVRGLRPSRIMLLTMPVPLAVTFRGSARATRQTPLFVTVAGMPSEFRSGRPERVSIRLIATIPVYAEKCSVSEDEPTRGGGFEGYTAASECQIPAAPAGGRWEIDSCWQAA